MSDTPAAAQTIAFDVYGTLVNTHGVVARLSEMVGDKAAQFSQTWRDKQLEYSFRRGLMRQYVDFSVCTRQALDFTCAYYQTPLSDADKSALLEVYKTLPAFADAPDALRALSASAHRLFAFSNGGAAAVEGLLQHAGIHDFFAGVVSVENVRSFKPDPAVYEDFLRRADAPAGRCWLVSGNPFDILGAANAGMNTAWVRRHANAVFDPWEVQPTRIIQSLGDLAAILDAPVK